MIHRVQRMVAFEAEVLMEMMLETTEAHVALAEADPILKRNEADAPARTENPSPPKAVEKAKRQPENARDQLEVAVGRRGSIGK